METQFSKRKDYVTIEAEKNYHSHTLIFLHGLGDTAEGFEKIFSSMETAPVPSLLLIPLDLMTQQRITMLRSLLIWLIR